MSNIAVIGDSTTVLAFRSLGVAAYAFDEPEEIIELWPDILEEGYVIIMMTEPIFEAARALIGPLAERFSPAVMPIPSVSGSEGAGRRQIQNLVEMVMGSIGGREERLG